MDVAAVQRRTLRLLFTTQVISGVGVTVASSVGALLAADIKRFMERPVNDQLSARFMPPSPAPPGAPIGDSGMDFLSRPQCNWDDLNPGQWLLYEPR